MKKTHYILLLLLCALPGMAAKKSSPTVATVTAEEEMMGKYYLHAAVAAWEKGEFADARALSELVLQWMPDDATAHHIIGLIHEGCKQNEQALAHYRKAYDGAPTRYWKRTIYLQYTTGDRKARKDAIRKLEDVSRMLPSGSEVWNMLADIYRNEEKWKKGCEAITQIERIDGPSAFTMMNRHEMLSLWGKRRKADKLLSDWLKENPDDPVGQMFYGEQLTRKGHWAEAIEHYKQVAATFPGYEPAPRAVFLTYVQWGDELMRRRRYPECFQAYEAALQLNPSSTYVLNNYAWTLALHSTELQKAERMSAITIQQEPQNATYLDTYAWILHLQGQDMLARIYIRKALECAIRNNQDTREIEQHKKEIEQ